MWSLDELAEAPLLAVCRVEAVQPGEPVPEGTLKWRSPTRNMRATLRVLRTFPPSERESLTLDYYGYGAGRAGTNGDANWPHLAPGDVLVFPLATVAGHWRLTAEEGRNHVVPAFAQPWEAVPVESGRGFLIRELVNILVRGGYRDIFRTTLFLRESAGLAVELEPALESSIGQDWRRWVDVASCALAGMGIPHMKLLEIRAAEPPRGMATIALKRLAERDVAALVIRDMIAHSDVHDWGAAATLQEFASHSALLQELPLALNAGKPGALYIAWWAIRADPGSPLLPVALAAAPKVLHHPASSANERWVATQLTVEQGSEAQFAVLVEEFRSAQQNDTALYYQIFAGVQSSSHPRVLRLCAIMLADRRIFGDQMRYCDIAGGRVQMFSGEKFGFTAWNQPLAQRDRAVEKAALWLRERSRYH